MAKQISNIAVSISSCFFSILILLNICITTAYASPEIVQFDQFSSNDTISYYSDTMRVSGRIGFGNSLITPTSISTSDYSYRFIEDAIRTDASLQVLSYGGRGGISTVSLRGSPSSSGVILLNGMRISSSQSGVFDFSNLSSKAFGEVQILESGAGVSYGSNAMSGAINLVPVSNANKELGLTYGSYQDISQSASYNLGGFNITGEFLSFAGNYPFAYQSQTVFRNNADFNRLNLVAGFESQDRKHTIMNYLYSTERGVPGAVTRFNVENESDRLFEIKNFLTYGYNSNSEFIDNNAKAMLTLGRMDFDQGVAINSARYNTIDLQLRNEFTYKRVNWLPDFITEGGYNLLSGDNLDPSVGSDVNRLWLASGLTDKFTVSDNLLMNYGARVDFFSDAGIIASGLLGISYQFSEYIIASSEVTYNGRAPSFNEMYYLNFGNTELENERNINIPVDISYKLETGDFLHSVNFNGYYTRYWDMIVSLPRTPLIISAFNLSSVEVIGLEANYGIDYKGVSIDFNYNRMLPEEIRGRERFIVPYMAQETFNTSLTIPIRDFKIRANTFYSSFRYGERFEEVSSILDQYFLLDLSVLYNFSIDNLGFELFISADNILDTDYQMVQGFPMPGRLLAAGINLIWK
ncbi:MAG: TonB-dependent vitamin B12 receptor [Candidatus Kapaibacteriales bacterium]